MEGYTELMTVIADAGLGVASFAALVFFSWQTAKAQKETTVLLAKMHVQLDTLNKDHSEIAEDVTKVRNTTHKTHDLIHTIIQWGGVKGIK